MWLSWSATLLLSTVAVWMLPAARDTVIKALQPAALLKSFWPVGAGILASAGGWLAAVRNKRRPAPCIPQGDLLTIVSRICWLVFQFCTEQFKSIKQYLASLLRSIYTRRPVLEGIRKLAVRVENRLIDWQTAGLILAILTGCLLALSLNP